MPELLKHQIDKLHQAALMLLSPGSILSVPAVLVALAIALVYLAWRQQRRRGRLRPAVIARALIRSRRLILHRSTAADALYFGINTFAVGALIGWGLFSGTLVANAESHALTTAFGARAPEVAPLWLLRVGATVVAFLGYELAYYVDHYLNHKVPFLWEFHKTHHTAEVLTPLTVYRVHPVDTLIFVDIVALVIGALFGLYSYLTGVTVNIYAFDHSNILTVIGLFLLSQLQHSQFWIPMRGLAGRLFLSPAHHQIHHSLDPAHHDRNLGNVLAVFAWMCGTLCIPDVEPQRLTFGAAQAGGDPHRLWTLLITPFGNAFRVIGLKRLGDALAAAGPKPRELAAGG